MGRRRSTIAFYKQKTPMKKIFFFDTETTGVDPSKDRIIQFGAIFGCYDQEKKKFHTERIINQLINPCMAIPARSTEIHGIDDSMVMGFGAIDLYIKEFLAYMSKADYIVGHNISFDYGMVKGELARLQQANILEGKKFLCTMLSHTAKYGGKRPKLGWLYDKYFGIEMENAHDALGDITATKDIFFEMVNQGEIVLQ